MMLSVNVITHFYVVIFILFLFTSIDIFVCSWGYYLSLWKKKIASLLKMHFLDEEAPSNPYSRKVNGLSCSLVIFVFYFISAFFLRSKICEVLCWII